MRDESNLRVTYKAPSLEAIADHLDQMGDEKRREAASMTRQRDQRDARMFAEGVEYAAGIIRATTIVSDDE